MTFLPEIQPVSFQTERLYLKELNPEIRQYLFSSCSDKMISDYLGISASSELESFKDQFKHEMFSFPFKTFILISKQDGTIIGRCGYHAWVKAHRKAELVYELYCEENKGKGLMREALAPVLSFGFEQMNLYRVEALTASYNLRSVNLLKHFGFSKEGSLKGHYMLKGKLMDSCTLCLLQPEYEEYVKHLKEVRTHHLDPSPPLI